MLQMAQSILSHEVILPCSHLVTCLHGKRHALTTCQPTFILLNIKSFCHVISRKNKANLSHGLIFTCPITFPQHAVVTLDISLSHDVLLWHDMVTFPCHMTHPFHIDIFFSHDTLLSRLLLCKMACPCHMKHTFHIDIYSFDMTFFSQLLLCTLCIATRHFLVTWDTLFTLIYSFHMTFFSHLCSHILSHDIPLSRRRTPDHMPKVLPLCTSVHFIKT